MMPLDDIKAWCARLGYRLEVSADGNEERWYRPDGSLAVTARRQGASTVHHTSEARVYGFPTDAVTRASTLVREIARVLLTGRPDAEFLRPLLIRVLTVELHDFMRGHWDAQK